MKTWSHEELCRDFNRRRPSGDPVGTTPWFNAKFKSMDESLNDVLRRYLRENEIIYLNTINGDVWFLYHDIWESCSFEVDGEWVHVYMNKYEGDLFCGDSGAVKVEVYETPMGEVLCGRCGYSLECSKCGDMPDVCPDCGVSLLYSTFDLK